MLRDLIDSCYLPGALLNRIKRVQLVYKVYHRMFASGFSLSADEPAGCLAIEIPPGYFAPVTDILTFIQTDADVPDWPDGPPVEGVSTKVREVSDTAHKPFGWLSAAFDGDCPTLDELVERLQKSKGTNVQSVSTAMMKAIPVHPGTNMTEVLREHQASMKMILAKILQKNPNPVFFGAERIAALLRTEAARRLYDHLHANTFSYPDELPRSRQMKELMELYENDLGGNLMERLPVVLAQDNACKVGNFVGAIEVFGVNPHPKLKALLGSLIDSFHRIGYSAQMQEVRTLFDRVVAHPDHYKHYLILMPEVRKECRSQRYLDWDMLPEYPLLYVPKSSPTADLIALEREMSEPQTE